MVQPRIMLKKCRASLIPEALIGMLLMTVITVTVGQTSVLVQRHLQASRHRRQAVIEASNLMTRAMARPWDRLTQQAVSSWQLPSTLANTLPQSQLKVLVEDQAGPPKAKCVTITIRWTEGVAGPATEVRLTGWTYHVPGDTDQ